MNLPQVILSTLAASAAVGLLGDAPAIAQGQKKEYRAVVALRCSLWPMS